jgi:hypothetical protein
MDGLRKLAKPYNAFNTPKKQKSRSTIDCIEKSAIAIQAIVNISWLESHVHIGTPYSPRRVARQPIQGATTRKLLRRQRVREQ